MKLKKLVAIVISLAMVLSIVPSFSLTAVAADMTDAEVLTYAKSQSTLFDALNPAPTAASDTDIATAWPNSGWTGTVNNGYLNVAGGTSTPRIQSYIGSYTNGSQSPNRVTMGDGYGAGNDWVLFSYILEFTCSWGDVAWYDIDGNILTALRYGTGDNACFAPSWGHSGWGSPYSFSNYTLSADGSIATSASGSTQVDLLFRNYDPDGTADSGDEYYTVTFFHNGTSVCVGTYTGIGNFNGLKYVDLSRGSGNSWTRISIQSPKVYAGNYPASTKTVEATYTVNGTTVHTESVVTESDTASFDAYYYRVNGENTLYYAAAQTLSESATIEMTALSNWGNYSDGDEIAVNSMPYKVVGGNIVPNGDFEHGMNGWYSRANTTPPTAYSVVTDNKPSVSERAAYSTGSGGASSTNSIKTGWKLEKDAEYYYSMWVWAADEWHGLGQADAPTTESLDIIGNGGFGTGSSWVQKTGTFTATKDYLVFFEGWGGRGLADVEVYKIELDTAKIASTTINYVDSSNTSTILGSTTVAGIVGDVIDLTDTSIVPSTITYNGNLYSKDDTNSSSYTVVGNSDVVTLTYTTDAITSVTSPATVTVLEGTVPVLPTTLDAETGNGAAATVENVVWDLSSLTVGTNTVNGSADGITASITATVIVKETTFTLDTPVFTYGQSDAKTNQTVFPVALAEEFTVEFIAKYTTFGDVWITMKTSDAGFFTPEQVALGSNSSGNFRPVNGNGEGGRTADDYDHFAIELNKEYRFLVTTSAATDKYAVTIYDVATGAVVDSFTDYGYRTNADAIEAIAVFANGGSGVVEVSNIKVNAPEAADLFTTYTVTITGAGDNNGTYTEKATWVEGVKIPYFEGYIFDERTTSGTSITYSYQAQKDTWGTWAIRNNVDSEQYLTETKFLGTHDSFANKSTAFTNEGGALYGTTGASSGNVSISQAQTLSALGQLNAGARYFDIRASRQEDGSFITYHGAAFNYLRPILTSIAQFAKENPGEVILLDFNGVVTDAQYTSDKVITDDDSYYGPDAGDENKYVYEALVQLLTETGILEYDLGTWDTKYGAATNYGEKSAILIFGRNRAANAFGDVFIYRTSALSMDTTYKESSSVSTVTSYIDGLTEEGDDAFGSGAKWGIIHAYTTPTVLGNLIDESEENNGEWIDKNLDSWMRAGYGDIFIMNALTEDIGKLYLDRMSEYNRDDFDDLYGKTTITSNNDTTYVGGLYIGATATTSIPFSTEIIVNADSSTAGELVGTEYTVATVYDISLEQYGSEVNPAGAVTITFPKASVGNSTVDVLLDSTGTKVAEAEVGEAISYSTTTLGNFTLATKAAPGVVMTVNYVDENNNTIYTTGAVEFTIGDYAYNVAAGEQYMVLGNKAYIVNSASEQKYTATADDTGKVETVTLTVISDNAVLADTFANSNASNDCNNTDNMLFAGTSGVSAPSGTDADGAATRSKETYVGSPRVPLLMFNVPTVGENQAVKLHLYVAKANGNLGVGQWMRVAVGTADVTVDEATGYYADQVANVNDIIWADTTSTVVSATTTDDGRDFVDAWVEVDVTNFVKAAEGDTITFTLYASAAGAYVADREKAVAGGAYAGKAAYLEVVDANTITVNGASKVTKNGTAVTLDENNSFLAYDGATVKLYETSASTPAFTDGTNVYRTDDTTGETAAITVNGDALYWAAEVGVTITDGAQVRIGGGVTDENKVGTNSGLRFIATVNRSGDALSTIEGAVFGMKLEAEAGATAQHVKAEKWQDEDNVFTVAITNILEGNYNRKFTATPYVQIGDEKFYATTSVERSIYQVAAGLLTTGDADGKEYDEGAINSEILYKVLNAYVNQTGIRLTLDDANHALVLRETGNGAYSGDAFFTVSDTTYVAENDTYTVTLTPVGEKTEILGYWRDYIRINNNNSAVKELIAETEVTEEGTLTITFDASTLRSASN